MKAQHKYKKAARMGNKEAQRRIAQSYGYKFSIFDSPKTIELLRRAGIELDPTLVPGSKVFNRKGELVSESLVL